ncbi:thiamine diphosphate-binding protein [Ilyonectria sp. MPI-CAGE-AT-0026]|nr:thiamine diphosphate-binding protein [Ilyonectria sp. MPI-CAGE-AT-0026]
MLRTARPITAASRSFARAALRTAKPLRCVSTTSNPSRFSRDSPSFAGNRSYGTAEAEAQTPAVSAPTADESFLEGSAASYIDAMYESWRLAPDSVHVSWRTYFRNMEDKSKSPDQAVQLPPGFLSSRDPALKSGFGLNQGTQTSQVKDYLKVVQLVSAYQSQGHHIANIDPLGLRKNGQGVHAGHPSELDPAYHGFTPTDLDRQFTLGPDILPQFAAEGRESMTLREIVAACESVYCGNFGVEYQHIPEAKKREWLRKRLEVPTPFRFSQDEKRRILDSLIWSISFERFIATKFPTEKRFGLDGAEGLAPGITSIIDRSADVHGIEDIIIGSCHRGRLTMMGTVYGKPREAILAEFAGRIKTDLPGMAGDAKYHLGHDGHRITPDGRRVGLSLLANPSHLEAVDPVATGSAYATQELQGDKERKRTMCLALHGDAAFSGQGVVYETLGLSRLDDYNVGGTIRVIVNNQIGFTTDVECSRSTPYASDLAKYINAPIIHVNSDDVEAVTFVCQLAADWRAEFQEDIVIDLVCYRKFGHNEFDQPTFTQPMMYKNVSSQTPTMETYVNKLVNEGTFTATEIEDQKKWVWDRLNENFETSKTYISERKEFPPAWASLPSPTALASEQFPIASTAVDHSILEPIANKVSSVPEGFELHPNLKRILAGRLAGFEEGSVDWSTAEALAFGTLCLDGHSVRLTGQDVQRGTFSQRHSVLHNQTTGETWTPLSNLSPGQARFQATNSPLSEFGALGFEYGVTLADPNPLVMWEAQFGDFANNTQVIIDNFIVAGESKWLDRSGLVLSLPHGFDGQGAEHSSARLERLTERIRILKREFRKPLVIFFSKSLLRHPICKSDVSEFTDPSATFQPVLADPAHEAGEIESPESISRVIICSGQIYASLVKQRVTLGLRDTAITRIEELHPFPWREVKANLDKYPSAQSVVWAQEEHYNGGAWHYIRDRLDAVLRKSDYLAGRKLLYAGRAPSASPAAGWKKIHEAEEKKLLEDAFSVQE